MVGRWEVATLEECGVKLIDCDHRTPAPAAAGYPYVAIPQLKEGRIDLADARRISPADFAEWTRKAKPEAFDVVLSRRCNPGETGYVSPGLSFALGQNLVLLRSDGRRVVPEFLRWLVRGPAWWNQVHKFINVGAVFDSLRCADIPKFELPIPPIDEQRHIARILGALDDKIDLNRRASATWEAIARALFKSWFVDFDPVRAKAEGRTPSGMDAETAKLFPGEFVDSEIGPIPRGWRPSTLGVEVERFGGTVQTGPFGSQLHASDYVTEGVPVVMPKDIVGRRVSAASIAKVRETDAARLSRHRLQVGDVVYSRRGDVERHALISSREAGWLCGTGCLLVRLGHSWPSPSFASFALDRPEARAWIVQHAIGATMPNLNTGILGRLPLLMPPDAVLAAFARCVDPLQALIEKRANECYVLAQTRDRLLPRLLSGELCLGSAEAAVAAAV